MSFIINIIMFCWLYIKSLINKVNNHLQNNMLRVCFLVSLILKLHTSAIFKFPIKKHHNIYEISTSLGDSNQNIIFALDLNANYTLYWGKRYPSSLRSQQRDNVTIVNKGSFINTQEIKDNISFISPEINSSIQITNYSFFYYDQETKYSLMTPHLIGLSYKFKNHEHSLIHQLKQLGLIQSLSFSLFKNKNYQKYICLGGIDLDNHQPLYQSSCKIRKNANNWECSLSSVMIKRQNQIFKYSSYDYVSFNSASSIYAPKSFINFFKDTILFDGIASKQCYILEIGIKQYIKCNEEFGRQIGALIFQIDNYDYSFYFYNGWSCLDGQCEFDIIENPFEDNKWIVGEIFFDQLEILFDYDNALIHFYSNKQLMIESGYLIKQIQFLLIKMISIIGCLGGCLIWYNLRRYKKYSQAKELSNK